MDAAKKHSKNSLHRTLTFFLFSSVLLVVVFTALWASSKTAYALPEYATRTDEPCAACHVNAGGGGPRTLRGLLWAAKGKPDKVPVLPGILIAPGVTDPIELYQTACGGCHGLKGEGLSAMHLVNTGVGQNDIRNFVLRGIPKLGMPSFEGQFTGAQLDSLVIYVAGLADGSIPPPPDFYRLAPPSFQCGFDQSASTCQKAVSDSGGN